MSFPLLAAAAFLLCTSSFGIPVENVARPRLFVVVHAEGRAAADAPLVSAATALARDIWRPYVDVAFGHAGDVWRTFEADRLDLIVTDRLLARGESSGLGWIQFVDDRPASTITVSTTAAERLMQASSWSGAPLTRLPVAVRRQFMTRALGRSIAHELGHYLLRSKRHARRGLMRDHLTADDIMETRHVKDRLEAQDLERLGRKYAAAMSGERPLS